MNVSLFCCKFSSLYTPLCVGLACWKQPELSPCFFIVPAFYSTANVKVKVDCVRRKQIAMLLKILILEQVNFGKIIGVNHKVVIIFWSLKKNLTLRHFVLLLLNCLYLWIVFEVTTRMWALIALLLMLGTFRSVWVTIVLPTGRVKILCAISPWCFNCKICLKF